MFNPDLSYSATLVCSDLPMQHQRLIRDELNGHLARYSRVQNTNTRLVFVQNNDQSVLPRVLLAVPEADFILTGLDTSLKSNSSPYPERLEELQLLNDSGALQMRRLVLVGDIVSKISEFLQLDLPVRAVFSSSTEDKRRRGPLPITSVNVFMVRGGRLDHLSIQQLVVGNILFSAILHTEENEKQQIQLKGGSALAQLIWKADSYMRDRYYQLSFSEKVHLTNNMKVALVVPQVLASPILDEFAAHEMPYIEHLEELQDAVKIHGLSLAEGIIDYLEVHNYQLPQQLKEAEKRYLIQYGIGDYTYDVIAQNARIVNTDFDTTHLRTIIQACPEALIEKLFEDWLQEQTFDTLSGILGNKSTTIALLRRAAIGVNFWASVDKKKIDELTAKLQVKLLSMHEAFSVAPYNPVDAIAHYQKRLPIIGSFSLQKITSSWNALGVDEQHEVLSRFIAHQLDVFERVVSPDLITDIAKFFLEFEPNTYVQHLPLAQKQVALAQDTEYFGYYLQNNNKVFVDMLRKEDNRELSVRISVLLENSSRAINNSLRRFHTIPAEQKKANMRVFFATDMGYEVQKKMESLVTISIDPINKFSGFVNFSQHTQKLGGIAAPNAHHFELDKELDPNLIKKILKGQAKLSSKLQLNDFIGKLSEKMQQRQDLKLSVENAVAVDTIIAFLQRITTILQNESLSAEDTAFFEDYLASKREHLDGVIQSVEDITANLDTVSARLDALREQIDSISKDKNKQEQKCAQLRERLIEQKEELQVLYDVFQRVRKQRKELAQNQKKLAVRLNDLLHKVFAEAYTKLGIPETGSGKMRGKVFQFPEDQFAALCEHTIVFCTANKTYQGFFHSLLKMDGLNNGEFLRICSPEQIDQNASLIIRAYDTESKPLRIHSNTIVVSCQDRDIIRHLHSNEELKIRLNQEFAQTEQAQEKGQSEVQKGSTALQEAEELNAKLEKTLKTLNQKLQIKIKLYQKGFKIKTKLQLRKDTLSAHWVHFESFCGKVKTCVDNYFLGDTSTNQQQDQAKLRNVCRVLVDDLQNLSQTIDSRLLTSRFSHFSNLVVSKIRKNMLARMYRRHTIAIPKNSAGIQVFLYRDASSFSDAVFESLKGQIFHILKIRFRDIHNFYRFESMVREAPHKMGSRNLFFFISNTIEELNIERFNSAAKLFFGDPSKALGIVITQYESFHYLNIKQEHNAELIKIVARLNELVLVINNNLIDCRNDKICNTMLSDCITLR